MFKPGDLVRHRSKPEWGVGRITGETSEGKVLIKFASRSGDVLLSADGAAQHLASSTAPITAMSPQATRKLMPPVRRTPCNTCSKDVRDVVSSPDGRWRSCVECSGRNGRQHVFLPYPPRSTPPKWRRRKARRPTTRTTAGATRAARVAAPPATRTAAT